MCLFPDQEKKRRISVELLSAWAVRVHGMSLGREILGKRRQGEDIPVLPWRKGSLNPRTGCEGRDFIPTDLGFPPKARQDLGSGWALAAAQLLHNGSVTPFQPVGAAQLP